MRVFIFGIGGTGSRVLRSLTMLLASGVEFKSDNLTIYPVIIDTDAHNGDTSRTRDLLRSYHSLRKTFVGKNVTSKSPSFFATPIRSFSRVDSSGTQDNGDLDVQFNFQNQDNTFANFVNYNGLSPLNKDLMELLYNDSLDDHPELYLNLSVGFKGNPNIGSIVFNDLIFSQQFKNLEASYTNTDRIFIISSIFGGTGSSGFPTLVKLIRTSKNTNLAKTKIGAITVMPYFNVESNDKSAINSAIFDTKTKAALSFYHADSHLKSVNALYYIADKDQGASLPNVEGGEGQVNNGHLIEFLSSTAIVDFINKNDDEIENPVCFEFGTENNANPFKIQDLCEQTKKAYITPFVKFAYAAKIATDLIPTLKDEAFYGPKELNIEGAVGVPNEYKRLITFFNEYKKWSAEELSNPNNGRVFSLFTFNSSHDHLNNLVHGKTIKSGFLDSGLSKKTVGSFVTKISLSEPKDMPIAEKYLTTLYKASEECLKTLGPLP
ncbi:MAG: tubulin-like doman-containing protein [Bacteroidetes bacterium]|nr:tubulin-like doman-containing protein [Bacteroidota bacterium]